MAYIAASIHEQARGQIREQNRDAKEEATFAEANPLLAAAGICGKGLK